MWVPIEGSDVDLDHLVLRILGQVDDDIIQQIIQVNALDPPYITTDWSFQRAAPAKGIVQFTLQVPGPLTIQAGTVVQTDAGPSGVVRSYTTDSPVTIPTQWATADVSVTATQPGSGSNVGPYRVTQVVGVSGVTVTNPAPITGGWQLRVLFPGDRIWLPDLTEATPPTPPKAREPLSHYDLAGGAGIYVTPTGGFLWGVQDLQLAEGPEEIGIEVVNRLRSPRGSVWYAPSEGSFLPGLKGVPAEDALRQAEILATADALQDDRLQDVEFHATADGTWIVLNGTLTLLSSQTTQISVPLA